MAQLSLLPKSDFEWLSPEEIKQFDVTKLNLEGDVGYIVECTLRYPKKLHLKHRHLPLAPTISEISYENLSPYAKSALFEADGQKRYKDVKLVSSFCDRIDYVCHAKNLKLYLELGMKLKKITRILKFKQERLFKSYIEKCTKARQSALTKFDKDQFKKLGKNLSEVGFEPTNTFVIRS